MDWNPTTFGEILENIIGGGTPSKGKPDYWNGNIPWASVKDMEEGRYRLSRTEDYITKEGLDNSATNLIPKGTVITSTRMGLGRVFINDVDMAINQDLKALFPKYGVHNDYLLWLIAANAGLLESLGSGTTVKGIRLEQLKAVNVFLPPLPTQRKIAALLFAYDDLIENNLRRIKILEEMAQNLYREWFVKFRFPGHQHARFTDSPLGPIPEGWEVVALEDVCSRITDGSHHSPKSVDFGYPMASVKDMHDWGINIDTCRKITEEEYQNLVRNDCKMRKDDVLIAKDGSYLKHCFVVEKDLDVALLSSIAMLRPNKRINPHVLAMTLREPDMKIRMTGFVSGAALPRIILQAFRQFQIVLPRIALQERWAASAEPMIQLCWRLFKANATLRHTRDLLLPKLISGEVDVTELDITVPEEVIT